MTNQNHEKNNRKPLRLAALAAAACLVLAIGGGSIYYNQSQTAASIVSLDVNPSIGLVLNRRERVLRATPLNEDAAAVVDRLAARASTRCVVAALDAVARAADDLARNVSPQLTLEVMLLSVKEALTCPPSFR